MTKLLKGGKVVNVFTGEIEETNVLIDKKKIIGVGDYYEEADEIIDVSGKYICPGFIDGHIHIESTMLLPQEMANICIPHGTCAVVADPHEIANVCGILGVMYMIEASEGLPLRYYFALPSCVPATSFDETGGILRERELELLYNNDRVTGLAEMMNYPGVIYRDPDVLSKLHQARAHKKIINGHAPLLSGAGLDAYLAQGITDDHECGSFDEALEKLRKGQWIMIRQGTSARNLEALIDLFDEPYCRRCLLATDDKHPFDLIENGHIDSIIREAAAMGKSVITGIRMATIQAAEYYGMRYTGAVAPGYFANLLVLNDLESVDICDVYHGGKLVCKDKKMVETFTPHIDPVIAKPVLHSFFMDTLTKEDLYIKPLGSKCRVIKANDGSLITDELIEELDFNKNNGIDTQRDIIKLAVCERHMRTGHIGLGFISGLGIKEGAIASTVSHDSHNLIIAGADEEDMALAGNTAVNMGGGLVVVKNGKVLAALPLPIAGLMSDKDAASVADENRKVREAAASLGGAKGIEPFMHTAFLSLSVIPNLKMTTHGLVDVNRQELVELFV